MRITALSVLGLTLLINSDIAFGEGRKGEQVYTASCATCHATGVANAPKAHDSAVLIP